MEEKDEDKPEIMIFSMTMKSMGKEKLSSNEEHQDQGKLNKLGVPMIFLLNEFNSTVFRCFHFYLTLLKANFTSVPCNSNTSADPLNKTLREIIDNIGIVCACLCVCNSEETKFRPLHTKQLQWLRRCISKMSA